METIKVTIFKMTNQAGVLNYNTDIENKIPAKSKGSRFSEFLTRTLQADAR